MSSTSAAEKPDAEAGTPSVDGLGSVGTAWMVGGRDFLAYRVTLLSKLLDRCTTRLLSASSGLSVAEWRALAQLHLSSPMSVRQLAEQAWVDRAEVSRATASLERRGCIERRENPKDRRSPMLYCTPAGNALAEQVLPSRLEFHRSLTSLLTPTQIEELEAALLILARHCVDELEAAPPAGPHGPEVARA